MKAINISQRDWEGVQALGADLARVIGEAAKLPDLPEDELRVSSRVVAGIHALLENSRWEIGKGLLIPDNGKESFEDIFVLSSERFKIEAEALVKGKPTIIHIQDLLLIVPPFLELAKRCSKAFKEAFPEEEAS